MHSRRSYGFVGFAAASFVTAMVCLIVISSVASSSSVSRTGVVIQENSLNAIPINVVGTTNINYRILVSSGGNISTYMIDQNQLTSLENGSSFSSFTELNCLDISQASTSGNLSSGEYYLVIVNGLSVNSTGPVTIDYHVDVGRQSGSMSLIGWIWSFVALIAAMAMAVGIVNLSREKRNKPATPKRPNTLR